MKDLAGTRVGLLDATTTFLAMYLEQRDMRMDFRLHVVATDGYSMMPRVNPRSVVSELLLSFPRGHWGNQILETDCEITGSTLTVEAYGT